jgi:hypothetical protein
LTEIWIDECECPLYQIPGYKMYSCCNENRRSAGLLCFVKNCWVDVVVRKELKGDFSDYLKLDLEIKNIKLTLIGIYRFHDNVTEFLNEFSRIMSNEKSQNLIILGDININILDNSNSNEKKEYLKLMASNGMESCINVPTRITPTSKTCIDHIFIRKTSSLKSNFYSAAFDIRLADHHETCLILNDPDIHKKIEHPVIVEKKKTNFELLNQNLRFEEWVDVFSLSQSDPSSAFNSFINILHSHINYCTITKSYTNKISKFLHPWMTTSLCNKLKLKNKLGIKSNKYPNNIGLRDRYKNFSRNLKKQTTDTKEKYYENELNKVKGNSKKEWEIVNSLLNRKKSKESVTCVGINNEKIYDKLEIASNFNIKFAENSSVTSKFRSSCEISNFDLVDDIHQPHSCYFEPITSLELFNIINDLDNSKSISHLGHSNFLIKKISLNIVDVLAHVLNCCVKEGVFPDCLKTAKVQPYFKKGDKQNMDNYRPISMLDTFSKIFEKAIKKRILNFLNSKKFFSNCQYGFRAGRSTENAFLKVISEIYDGLNSGLETAALFIDIKKAFDSVDHMILLGKLQKIGFRGNIYKLFESYLCNRKQYVDLDGYLSEHKSILLGVPQGSVLGPILFLIYFNSLLQQKFKGKLTAFADDVAITYGERTYFDLFGSINHDLDLIRRWFLAHKMVLSDKTKMMYFSIYDIPKAVCDISYHDPNCNKFSFSSSYNNSVSCHCDCFKIEAVDFFLYVGNYIDFQLNWCKQINYLEKYSLSVIRQFYFLKKSCSIFLLRNIYHALFHSKIQYGIVGYGGARYTYLSCLLLKQKCIIRIILGKRRREPSFELFRSLNILPIKHLFYYKVLKIFFCKSGYWRYRNNFNYNLRSNNLRLMDVPRHNVNHFLKSFTSTAPRLYNKLPRHIINENALSKKLLEIKRWLFSFDHLEIENLLEIVI